MAVVHAPSRFVDPGRMTGRAQAYMLVVGLRNLLLGASCLVIPDTFRSPGYNAIKHLAPGGLLAWGVVTLVVGVICIAGTALRNEGIARTGLLSSATVSAAWAGGFFAAWAEGNLVGPTGVIVWTAVTLKDLIVCRQPMRSPFEPLVRQVLARQREERAHGESA